MMAQAFLIRNQQNRGFTLVEVIIVVAIIALLAAISIPNLLASRMLANETNAITAIKSIVTAEFSYQNANGRPGNLTQLSAAAPPYIDAKLGSGSKGGYNYTVSINGTVPTIFFITARPISNMSGRRVFCATEQGIIKFCAGNCTPPASRAQCDALQVVQ